MNYFISQENALEDQQNHLDDTQGQTLKVSKGEESNGTMMQCEEGMIDLSNMKLSKADGSDCQNNSKSLLCTSRLLHKPRPVESTQYIPPLCRASSQFPGLSLSNGILMTQNGLESFTLSFLKRTMRNAQGAIVSEVVIPVVQLVVNSQAQSDPAISQSNSPQIDETAMIRIRQVINRIFQTIHDLNNVNQNLEADWNVTMDETHTFDTTINPNRFPFIAFATGNNRMDSTQISNILENMISNQPNRDVAAATQEQLDKLPECAYPEKDCRTECSVCQAEYQPGDKLVKLPCSHDYHKDCVIKWLKQNNSCPICRKSLE